MTGPTRHPLSSRFERFAHECSTLGSNFYERLSTYVSGDAALLEIADDVPRQPVPNIFFGAIHYLLLQGADHELRDYYPSINPQPRTSDALFPAFSDFCVRSRDELIPLLTSRLTQTNEVNRSAVLAPAFSVVAQLGNRRPLSLVEVGTSAGLNLFWDRYRIAYSDGVVLGDPQSSVHLTCEIRGAPLPVDNDSTPNIGDRIGIDLNPIDINDAESRLWLRALVWPDHPERARRLDAAIKLVSPRRPKLLRGDSLKLLPAVLRQLPRESTPCVYHSSVLYQFTPDAKAQFTSLLGDASADRPVWHVSAENEEGLKLFTYRHGQLADEQLLADFDAHGRWLCWKAN